MSKKETNNRVEDFEVGYKKPPRQSQFQPGKSGNPNGRPKKSEEIADVLQKELSTMVPILRNGRRQKISMLRAIFRQHLTKAAAGDPKAAAIVLSVLRSYKPNSGDNLGELLQEFRTINLRLMETKQKEQGMDAEDKGPASRSETES